MVTAVLKMCAASWPYQSRPSEEMCLKDACSHASGVYLRTGLQFSLVLPKVTWEYVTKQVLIFTW